LSSLFASGFFSIVRGLVENDVTGLARLGGCLEDTPCGDGVA